MRDFSAPSLTSAKAAMVAQFTKGVGGPWRCPGGPWVWGREGAEGHEGQFISLGQFLWATNLRLGVLVKPRSLGQ